MPSCPKVNGLIRNDFNLSQAEVWPRLVGGCALAQRALGHRACCNWDLNGKRPCQPSALQYAAWHQGECALCQAASWRLMSYTSALYLLPLVALSGKPWHAKVCANLKIKVWQIYGAYSSFCQLPACWVLLWVIHPKGGAAAVGRTFSLNLHTYAA